MAHEFQVVMVRHGESEWNQKNLFCGWYNANLSARGNSEAILAGQNLKIADLNKFDIAFTSVLTRAHDTLNLILKELDQTTITVVPSWRLNERHYGALTGLNKADTVARYGEDQVAIWRRSFDVPPPPMLPDHPYYRGIVEDARYAADGPRPKDFPKYESLEMTMRRTLPFWTDTIVPEIVKGRNVLIVAHGNSLRGIIMHLDSLSKEEIMEINLPTGIPFTYTFDGRMNVIVGKSMQFLGDAETVRRAMEEVAQQGKFKK